ncbi:hypothetical protein CLU92_4194 [Janthinobacterium sp. 61]|nr:hypothetical protein CLU92_4194 [Janthinobacterium sp. 61]
MLFNMSKPVDTSKKLGRKPIGPTNLTPAERQRRYREKMREKGGKDFLLTLAGLHLQGVEAFASAHDLTASTALRLLVEPALDRYVGIMNRIHRMAENGATDEACAQFMSDHLYPELPEMEASRKAP